MRQFTGLFRGNQYFKHKIEEVGGGGRGVVSTSLTLPLDPPEYLFSDYAPKCNRTEIMLDVNESS